MFIKVFVLFLLIKIFVIEELILLFFFLIDWIRGDLFWLVIVKIGIGVNFCNIFFFGSVNVDIFFREGLIKLLIIIFNIVFKWINDFINFLVFLRYYY